MDVYFIFFDKNLTPKGIIGMPFWYMNTRGKVYIPSILIKASMPSSISLKLVNMHKRDGRVIMIRTE